MALTKDKRKKKEEYFHLSEQDRLDFDREDKEKAEKEKLVNKVFERMNGKEK
ncbi:hypothetical protein [Lentibacillus sediminis]|uniref:hypothetical protein n=1 Tax=Lentibacillus sediminis TaxID=1940529 RepID=UPI001304612B|nr:hypothetical protein [Lentibacillus sediminis]